MPRRRIIGDVVAVRRDMDGKRMDTHSDLVTAISANHGNHQIQPITLPINRNRLIQWNHKLAHPRIHHWYGHAPRGHLMLTEPQVVQAVPVTTDHCLRLKVDEDDKKEELNHHLLLNHVNVDYQACLIGHASTSRAASKDCGVMTQQLSSRNVANYTFDGFMRRNQRCV